MQEKARSTHNLNLSEESDHGKVVSTTQANPSPPNNDVMNTKPLLAYSSQNLASCGYEKCLDTLKIDLRGLDKNAHPPPTTKIHPQSTSTITKMITISKPLDYVM